MYYETGKHLKKDRQTELLIARKQRKAEKRRAKHQQLLTWSGLAA